MTDAVDMRIDKLLDALYLIKDDISMLQQSQQETDRRMQETDRRMQKIDRKFSNLLKKFEEIGLVQGEFAEDSIRRNIEGDLHAYGIHVDRVEEGLIGCVGDIQREYDIVAINGDTIVVVEVKNKMHKRYIKKFVTDQLPLFKKIFPQYQNYTVYGGLGALIFHPELEQHAQDLGLFIFGQKGNTIALHNTPGFVPKAF